VREDAVETASSRIFPHTFTIQEAGMVQTDKPVLRVLGLLALVAITVAILAGGFIILQTMQGSKILMTLFAVVWGLGSVALLFFVMNSVAQTMPRKIRSVAVAVVFAGPAVALLFWALVLPTLRTLFLSFFDATGKKIHFYRQLSLCLF